MCMCRCWILLTPPSKSGPPSYSVGFALGTTKSRKKNIVCVCPDVSIFYGNCHCSALSASYFLGVCTFAIICLPPGSRTSQECQYELTLCAIGLLSDVLKGWRSLHAHVHVHWYRKTFMWNCICIHICLYESMIIHVQVDLHVHDYMHIFTCICMCCNMFAYIQYGRIEGQISWPYLPPFHWRTETSPSLPDGCHQTVWRPKVMLKIPWCITGRNPSWKPRLNWVIVVLLVDLEWMSLSCVCASKYQLRLKMLDTQNMSLGHEIRGDAHSTHANHICSR